MSRTMSAIAIIILAGAFLIILAPAASAEYSTKIPLPYSFPRAHTNITVYLDDLELSDYRMGNVYTSTPLDRVYWVRLWYHYENNGDRTEEGYLTVKLIDSYNNTYDEPEGTYTGENTGPHSRSVEKFLEWPIPKDAKITKIKSIQSFDETIYVVPGTPTPTVTPAATASAAPTSSVAATAKNPGSCLPLLPFVILGALGLTGIAAGKIRMKK